MGVEEGEEKQSCEVGKSEINKEKEEENILSFLDSVDTYLILMNHLSSTLRQGWMELASARHSMGTSRISSALFDLKYHNAATTLQVDQDDDSNTKQPHLTLCKWASPNEEECFSREANHKEDDSLWSKSGSPQLRHRGPSQNTDFDERKTESNGSSPIADDQARKERLKSLSLFGTLVSPKLRAAQLSFETALETLVEIANTRSALLGAYDEVSKTVAETEK